MMSAETKRKISEALKAYYAGKGSARSKVGEAVAKTKGTARLAATDAENKIRSGYAKLTPSKVDDITTKIGNTKRTAVGTGKSVKDVASAKLSSVKIGVEAAKPAAKEAAKSLKSDLKSATKAKVQSLRDKTTLDEKAVELYGKAKEKITGKKRLPKTYKV